MQLLPRKQQIIKIIWKITHPVVFLRFLYNKYHENVLLGISRPYQLFIKVFFFTSSSIAKNEKVIFFRENMIKIFYYLITDRVNKKVVFLLSMWKRKPIIYFWAFSVVNQWFRSYQFLSSHLVRIWKKVFLESSTMCLSSV